MRKYLLLILSILLAGCIFNNGVSSTPDASPTLPTPAVTTISAPDPELAAAHFLDALSEQVFDEMYALLSPLTQDAITEEDFASHLGSIWESASLTGIDYEIVSSLVNPRAAQVRYRISLISAVIGTTTRETWMDLVRENGIWRISWSDSIILPELVDGNKLLLDMVIPTRANIYDHNGLALATETDVAALWLVPNEIGNEDAEATMLSVLSRLLHRRTGDILKLYDNKRQYDWYVHLGEASLDELQKYESTLESVGGVYWKIYPTRYYVDSGVAEHAIGYVNWIPEEDLQQYLMNGYRRDEFVGQRGLEAEFETELRGKPGGTLYLTNANDQVIKALASSEPELPQAVYSTLDRDLQLAAQQAIAGFNGAIVVLERDTGKVLSLVSSPGFDPNLFDPQHPYSTEGIQDIYNNINRPLFNRAADGEYPAGSTFKMITMAAALESDYFEPDTIYNCGWEFRDLPGVVLYDWTYEKEKPPQGEITLMQALERSCNPYFFHIGLELYNNEMETAIPDMAKAFGLGSSTGIEIGDQPGLIPDPETRQALYNQQWGPGDSVNLAIGQSYMQSTPLQIARYIAAIGNGGTLYRPQLVSKIQNAEGIVSHEFEPDPQGTVPVSPENLQAIQDAMVQVIRAPKGTARNRFLGLNINLAGKTGTATSGEYSESHSWFAGYTFEEREDNPDIVVVVLVEHQGEGSEWAAPIFRRVVESYFFGQPYAVYPWESQIGVEKTATPTPGPEELEEEATPTP